MQNVTKIPFFWLVTLWYPGGNIDKIYILSKSQGLVVAKPYPPLLFEEKKNSLFILVFFLHFKTKIPKKKDMVWICGWPSSLVYVTKAYWTFVLFHFSWNKIKNNKTIIVVKGPLPPSREGRGATFNTFSINRKGAVTNLFH